jgi:hypothetical protein
MKRIKYLLLFTMFSGTAFSQLYLSSITGYSFATKPYTMGNMHYTNDTLRYIHNARYIFGKGLNLGLGMGYKINDDFSIELSINTQVCTKSEFNNHWEKYFDDDEYGSYFIPDHVILKNSSLQIAPEFIYSVTARKIKPYIKAGINFLCVQTTEEKQSYYNHITYTEVEQIHGGFNVGFRGSIGFYYQFSGKLNLYSELMTVNTNYKFKKVRVVSYSENGVDFEISQTQYTYQKTEGRVDYSQIGLNVGIRYLLCKKHE